MTVYDYRFIVNWQIYLTTEIARVLRSIFQESGDFTCRVIMRSKNPQSISQIVPEY